MEKELAYYIGYERKPKHFEGNYVYLFNFRGVESGEYFSLGYCYEHGEELSNFGYGHFYNNILDMCNDFDIIWELKEDRITPSSTDYEVIQKEYEELFEAGEPNVNDYLLQKYSKDTRINKKTSEYLYRIRLL